MFWYTRIFKGACIGLLNLFYKCYENVNKKKLTINTKLAYLRLKELACPFQALAFLADKSDFYL